MLGKRIMSVAISAVLVASLSPAAAFASSLGSAGGASLSAQAKSKTETVYVVSSVTVTSNNFAGTRGEKYKYNSKKLLKRVSMTSPFGGNSVKKWAYKKKGNLATLKKSEGGGIDGRTDATFAMSSKGKMKRASWHYHPWEAGLLDVDYAAKFSYKSGKVSRRTVTQTPNGVEWRTVVRDKLFYNKKKQLRAVKSHSVSDSPKAIISNMTESSSVMRYKYDKRGNITRRTYSSDDGYSVDTTFKNKYNKSGRLVKKVAKNRAYGNSCTYEYKYKAVKVPKAMTSRVEAQQWAILNGNLNFALDAFEVSAFGLSATGELR